VVACIALALAATIGLPAYLAPVPAGNEWVVVALQLGVWTVPVAALVASRAYWIRRGTITLDDGQVVVPGRFLGEDRFTVTSLRVERLKVVQDVYVGPVPTGMRLDRGERVTLREGARQRTVSERVLSPGALACLLADLDALARGEPARGPAGWSALFDTVDTLVASVPRPPRDPAEDRLDAELQSLDS
jgi:hypothetical protein